MVIEIVNPGNASTSTLKILNSSVSLGFSMPPPNIITTWPIFTAENNKIRILIGTISNCNISRLMT